MKKDTWTCRSYELIIGADKGNHFTTKELEYMIKNQLLNDMIEINKTTAVTVELRRTYNED